MPSPFPGMNPYLEAPSVWHDFHESFFPAARELLAPQVRPRYIVKIDERIYVHDTREESRQFFGRADISLASRLPPATAADPTATALAEAPAEVTIPELESERLSYLEILDRDSREVITVVELLSPSNKDPGPDRDQYLARRRQLLVSPVHFVEIDLLRAGRRMPWNDLPSCDYCAVISRADRRPQASAWPIRLRDPLPVLPIPLRPGDPDARFDILAVLNRIYDAAGYEDYIYTTPPVPPLPPADAAWATSLLPR